MLEEYVYLSGSLFLFFGLPLIALMVVLTILLTWSLSRQLDKLLFNENYFSPQEMLMFSSFPLSLLKTLAYIRLITFPHSLRKRFGDIVVRDKINSLAIILSYFTMTLIILNTLTILNLFVAIGMNYIRLEF